MARISTYVNDTTVQKTDKFIGSNSGGSTKNFQLSDISKYLRATNSGGVGGQVAYVYHDNTFNGTGARQPGTISLDSGGAANVAFSSITALKLSKYPNGSDYAAPNYLETFENTTVIIADTENQDVFGTFYVSDVSQDSSETNFYDLTLAHGLSNGGLQVLRSYSISVFSAGDRNFVSNQLNFSAGVAQTITHNLGKFPSVTVVKSNGKEIIGEVQHINTNSLTVTFQNAFAAKVYVN